jgi:hypothetical protein
MSAQKPVNIAAMPDDLVSVDDLAAEFQRHPQSIREWLAKSGIRKWKKPLDKRVWVSRADFDAWRSTPRERVYKPRPRKRRP